MTFDWRPVWLSLQVAAVALVIVAMAGTAAAHFLARRPARWRSWLEALFLLPLVLPPVVVGYALLLLLGRHGWMGAWLDERFGLRLLFTPAAAIIAAAVVAFPLMYQSAKAAFFAVDPLLEEMARSLGASPWRVFWTITVPLAWPGLWAGAVLSFARALGEFGATIMVAGNIAGRTTTVSTAIYMAAEGGEMALAGRYALLLALANLLFVLAANAVWGRRRNGRKP